MSTPIRPHQSPPGRACCGSTRTRLSDTMLTQSAALTGLGAPVQPRVPLAPWCVMWSPFRPGRRHGGRDFFDPSRCVDSIK
ncbi:hypothetical protein PGTUg99_008899 [Puccinia graminis f. sp. tritici]|uniref:Uncharacterized protein n=1 Tax=Puccinia graminis f. sp. tritici TaxID=56615 RepID=A0A5B0NIA1_PUCGR|nr:hypothetical protein PGTUg99_008899 [Puccinia graminis f. sp. tritici]